MRIVSASGETGDWVGCGYLRFDALYFGGVNDPDSPVAIFVIASPDTGDRVAGLRTHDTQVLIAVISGSIELDGAWFGQGDMQFVKKGAPHGDLVVGPEGATFVIFFSRRKGMIPSFIEEEDRENFDRDLRVSVEAVAAGKSEESVALLPPRRVHRARRGIKVTDLSAGTTNSADPVQDLPAPEGIFRTRIDNDELPWGPEMLNARTSMVILGDLDDDFAPAVGVINVKPGPGDRLRSRHIHKTEAVNLVIEGALYMDGVWLRPGESKVVAADYEYGDGLAGPEGVKFLEVWADQFGAMPVFADSEDQQYFEEMRALGHLTERLRI